MLELTEMERDTLAEVGNISLGAAATALSTLLNRRVQITTPRVSITTMQEVRSCYPVPCMVITVTYLQGLDGDNVLIMKEKDAALIAALMMGMSPGEASLQLGEMEMSAVSEAMNQMMGSASTAMSDFFGRTIEISPPAAEHKDLGAMGDKVDLLEEESKLIQISFDIEVEEVLNSELIQLIPLKSGRGMAKQLMEGIESEISSSPTAQAAETYATVEQYTKTERPVSSELPISTSNVEKDTLVNEQGNGKGREHLGVIRDIPVEIVAVLGRVHFPFRRLFALGPGDIVELEKFVGEPVELVTHNRVIARGETVLVNGQLGVRITALEQPKKNNTS